MTRLAPISEGDRAIDLDGGHAPGSEPSEEDKHRSWDANSGPLDLI